METLTPKPRLRLLLDHFAAIEDDRPAWRVMYPLREVLFLVVCATICSCDDYEDIVDWGEARLDFLRRYLDFHWGVPCADWLRTLMNRVDPELFSACFMAWVAECWPDRQDMVAIDGKTSRRSHDRREAGKAPLHLVSAFATNTRLVLGQEATADKGSEVEAIPVLLGKLAEAGSLKGALVTIDAIACNPKIASEIVGHGADYLLAVKANQPSLRDEVERFFADAPPEAIDRHLDLDKDFETADAALEYGQALTGTSDFDHNLRTLANQTMVERRSTGMLAYLIPSFFRASQREFERVQRRAALKLGESQYVGAVGHKIGVKKTHQIAPFEAVLYGYHAMSGYYGPTHIYRFRSADGNVFVWFASEGPAEALGLGGLDAANRVKVLIEGGSVTKHIEYDGVKQTYLTRCKVRVVDVAAAA